MKPFIGPNSFRMYYNLYVFDITNQKEHIGAQPISVDFKFYNSPDVRCFGLYSICFSINK